MQDGDILIAREVKYIDSLELLWDVLSDAIEGGRLTESDIPDDYAAFVTVMQECEAARNLATRELES